MESGQPSLLKVFRLKDSDADKAACGVDVEGNDDEGDERLPAIHVDPCEERLNNVGARKFVRMTTSMQPARMNAHMR